MTIRSAGVWCLVFTMVVSGAIAIRFCAAQEADDPSVASETEADNTEKSDTEKPDTEKSDTKKPDPLKVPVDGSSAELLSFLETLMSTPPTSREAAIKRRDAFRTANECILKLEEKTPKSKMAATARGNLFQLRLAEFGKGGKDEGQILVDDLAKHLDLKGDALEPIDAFLATTVGRLIERSGDTKLAAKAYESFGKKIAGAKDQEVAATANQFKGIVRRLNLLGSKMEVEGTTVDGKKFDWTAYRGKYVLVDYWATWCGPCLAELPSVRRHYELYHDRGFEVVGISLDRDQQKLKQFLDEAKIPWVTLFEENAQGGNTMAERYGVQAVPTVILLDKEGKAISLNARGAELGRLLEKHIGPAEPEADDAAKENPDSKDAPEE